MKGDHNIMGRFYICRRCGAVVGRLNDAGHGLSCCGALMEELKANSVDAAKEKHVPSVTVSGDTVTVTVGDVLHPMTEEHLIQWVYLEMTDGGQRKSLAAGKEPKVTFKLSGGKPKAVYAYCNLHGLWVKEL